MTAQAPYESLREVVEALATACRDGLIHNTSDEDTVGVLEDAARAALAANKPAGEDLRGHMVDSYLNCTRQAQAQGSEGVQALRDAINNAESFMVVMYGDRNGDVPETIRSPLGFPIKVGQIVAGLRAALDDTANVGSGGSDNG